MKKTDGKKMDYEKPELFDVAKSPAEGIEVCENGSADAFLCDTGHAADGKGCINGVGASGSF